MVLTFRQPTLTYSATNVKNYKLWAYIQIDFKKFEAKHFDKLDSSIWKYIQKYYYLHKFWIDVNNGLKTFTIVILKVIAADYYDE